MCILREIAVVAREVRVALADVVVAEVEVVADSAAAAVAADNAAGIGGKTSRKSSSRS